MDLPGVRELRRARSRADLRLADGETVLAGGTWLFSEPQPGVTGLVDLTDLGWSPWTVADGLLSLAATCTLEQLLAVPGEVLGRAQPLVRGCVDALLMSHKIARVATVGGNVALALPAAATVSLLSGLGATALVWTPGGGERLQPVAELVTGVRRTTLAPGEVLRSLEVPLAHLAQPSALRTFSLAPMGRSAGVVVGRLTGSDLALSVTAATTRPVVLRLPGSSYDAWAAALVDGLAGVDCWYDDPHGPADWREAVTGLLAREVLAELADQVTS